ncbi:MAG: 2-amino-4-hydroxy-6-hydroxymethyldihydropteridine diphosphokinase [Dehalococcoidia bacterium]|nr:2-amino-4-hydroxy-6-hydroxymethyldihydropteridine diphosphokinase [Dehalococcoidia bacterium]
MSGYTDGGVEVHLGLGSNLGNRAANLRMALAFVEPLVRIEAVSSLYRAAPVGPIAQPDFYNAVCRGRTGLAPGALLRYLKSVEFEIGRRSALRWGPRVIDIDILLYGDRAVESSEVVVPHPGLAERAFVLVPLAEISPDVVHPLLGRSAAKLTAALSEEARATVRLVEGRGWERAERQT